MAPNFVCGTTVNFTLTMTYTGGSDVLNFSIPTTGSGYSFTTMMGQTIVPGATNIGNSGDDVTTNITLPFLFSFYGVPFTAANVSSNGNLQFTSNSPQPLSESGVAAPAGFFWSEVQHDTGNTTQANSIAGFAPTQGSFRLADDFTIGQRCSLATVVFFAYQTGAPATPSPFVGYTLQIWNGRPGDPGAMVIFGDTTTNRLASSVDSTFFRIFNSLVPPPGSPPGTTRKIWANTVTINTTLPAGTYWLDWASSVTGGGAHFQPSKTIAGSRGAVGDNARQQTVSTGVWADVIDTGAPASAPDVIQDFPFDEPEL